MKHLAALLLLPLAMAGPAGAAPPEIGGWYEVRPEPDGKTPFAVHGWAVCHCAPCEVEVRVDGATHWRGETFSRWPGVAERHPDDPGAARAGFWVSVDPSRLAAGERRLEVFAVAEECGRQARLGAGTFTVEAPTSAAIAWPGLFLILAAVPGLLGFGLARLPARPREIPRLQPAIALLLAALAVTMIAARHLGSTALEIAPGIFAPLANWDGRFYLQLATEGYSAEVPRGYAYFPLFPWTLRLLALSGLPLPLLAAVLNGGCFLLAITILRRLDPRNDGGVLLLATLPFAFFFVAAYTESLFLLLAVGFVHALRRDRPGWALVCGALAGLTRVTGVALVAFAVDSLVRRRFKQAAVAAGAPLAGLGLWMLVLWRTTGDPLKFFHVQETFGRATSFHPGRLLDILAAAVGGPNPQARWELFFLLAILAGAAALFARGRWSEGLYSATVVLMSPATLSLNSVSRYALAAFPAILLYGSVLPKRWAFRIWIALQTSLLFYFAARFGRHYWVA